MHTHWKAVFLVRLQFTESLQKEKGKQKEKDNRQKWEHSDLSGKKIP